MPTTDMVEKIVSHILNVNHWSGAVKRHVNKNICHLQSERQQRRVATATIPPTMADSRRQSLTYPCCYATPQLTASSRVSRYGE